MSLRISTLYIRIKKHSKIKNFISFLYFRLLYRYFFRKNFLFFEYFYKLNLHFFSFLDFFFKIFYSYYQFYFNSFFYFYFHDVISFVINVFCFYLRYHFFYFFFSHFHISSYYFFFSILYYYLFFFRLFQLNFFFIPSRTNTIVLLRSAHVDKKSRLFLNLNHHYLNFIVKRSYFFSLNSFLYLNRLNCKVKFYHFFFWKF